MGMGNAQQQNQVYFDPQTNQYYTQTNPYGAYGMPKNFLTGLTQATTQNQKSPISDLLAQAMAAKANPVSIEQLFPSMNAPTMGNPMTNFSGLLGQATPFGQGQFGAGRFLSGNTMGNTGMTSNAMSTM